MFHSRGLMLTIALGTNEVQTAIGLVVAGFGYALLPQSLQDLDHAGVQYLPLSDAEVSSPILLIRRKDGDSELMVDVNYLGRRIDSSELLPVLTRCLT